MLGRRALCCLISSAMRLLTARWSKQSMQSDIRLSRSDGSKSRRQTPIHLQAGHLSPVLFLSPSIVTTTTTTTTMSSLWSKVARVLPFKRNVRKLAAGHLQRSHSPLNLHSPSLTPIPPHRQRLTPHSVPSATTSKATNTLSTPTPTAGATAVLSSTPTTRAASRARARTTARARRSCPSSGPLG